MVNFVLFFALDGDRFWRRWGQSSDVIAFIGREAIHMEDVVDAQCRGKCKLVIDVTAYFEDFERSQLFWTELSRLLMYFDLLSLQPYVIPNVEVVRLYALFNVGLHSLFT